MTDPTGRSFLSYRRSQAADAKRLIEAQHDVGIPTWQDVRDLPEEQAEESIRTALQDPRTASALLWLTPNVAGRPMIQKVEIPEALNRVRRGDGFFVIPVLAHGLKYEEVANVLDPRFASDLRHWNLRRIDSGPLDAKQAAQAAAWVLRRRIEQIDRALPPGAPFPLALYTREPAPFRPGQTALALDWSHRFAEPDRREALPGVWEEHLLPALKTVARELAAGAPGRPLEVEGLAVLPACFALGCAFLSTRAVPLAWRQVFPNGKRQLWSLADAPEPSGFTAHIAPRDPAATDFALLVSVTEDVEPAFAASHSHLPPFRAIVRITREGGFPHRLETPGQAVDLVQTTIAALRQARRTYREDGAVHLFLSVPSAVALMLGQSANTFGPTQTYQHFTASGLVGIYRPSVRLVP